MPFYTRNQISTPAQNTRSKQLKRVYSNPQPYKARTNVKSKKTMTTDTTTPTTGTPPATSPGVAAQPTTTPSVSQGTSPTTSTGTGATMAQPVQQNVYNQKTTVVALPIDKFKGDAKERGQYAQDWLQMFILAAASAGWDEKDTITGLGTHMLLGSQAWRWYKDLDA